MRGREYLMPRGARHAHCLLLLLLGLSCSKPQDLQAPSPPPVTTPSPEAAPTQADDDGLSELERLERELERDLARLGARPSDEKPLNAAREEAPKPRPKTSSSPPAAGAGRTAEKSYCEQTRELVDSICEASRRICEITDRLPPEAGGAPRCERARLSCSRAREQEKSSGCTAP